MSNMEVDEQLAHDLKALIGQLDEQRAAEVETRLLLQENEGDHEIEEVVMKPASMAIQ